MTAPNTLYTWMEPGGRDHLLHVKSYPRSFIHFASETRAPREDSPYKRHHRAHTFKLIHGDYVVPHCWIAKYQKIRGGTCAT